MGKNILGNWRQRSFFFQRHEAKTSLDGSVRLTVTLVTGRAAE